MSTEAVGDIVQAALTARAAEPAHGEHAPGEGHSHESACLNCGTALLGSHCHACGQAAHVHRTLAAFFHDLIHGVFHFEGKIWRTLPLLAWQPGRLTREYIDGRRASYVSPIALFLFVVFLSFAVFNAIKGPVHFNAPDPQQAAVAIQAAQANLAKLRQTQAEAAARGEEVPGLDGQIEGAETALQAMQGALAEKPKITTKWEASPNSPRDKAINEAWDRATANPELAIYKLQSSAYKYSWLLIPLSVPFVWLLFPFSRRYHLYDHMVFVTYSISFMLLLTAVISLAVIGNWTWLVPLLLLYAPFHMYRQLRDAYALSRFGAWWRTWFLATFALMALTQFAVAMTLLATG